MTIHWWGTVLADFLFVEGTGKLEQGSLKKGMALIEKICLSRRGLSSDKHKIRLQYGLAQVQKQTKLRVDLGYFY